MVNPRCPTRLVSAISLLAILAMEATLLDEQTLAEFGHWLNVECRCFGDKGDVEDITEGQCIAP